MYELYLFKWNLYAICLCLSVKRARDSEMKKKSGKKIIMRDQELLDDPPILLFGTMYARPEKSTRLLSE
jgi:hypothetical protein